MMATANVKASIEAANKNWMNAFKKTLMHLPWLAFTRQGLNCFRLTNSDVVEGTDAIRSFWQSVMNMGIKNVVLETIEVEDLGDTAIEGGRYRLLVANGSVADGGKYIVVWKNEGGTWKLHRDIWTTSQRPQN
jgi:ketosteroid isomerase-like protein